MKKLMSIVISILFAFSMTGLAFAQGQDRPAPAAQMKAEQKAPKAEKKKAKKAKKAKKVKKTKKAKKY